MAGLARRLSALPLALALALGCASGRGAGREGEAEAIAESAARSLEVLAASGLIARAALAVDPSSPQLSDEAAQALSTLAPCVSAAPVSGRVSASFGEAGQPCLFGDLALSGALDVTYALLGDSSLQLSASVDPAAPLSVGGAEVLGAIILVRPANGDEIRADLELRVAQGGESFLSGRISFVLDESGELIADGVLTLDAGDEESSLLLSALRFSPNSRSPEGGEVSYEDGQRAAVISFQPGARGPELSVRPWDSERPAIFSAVDLL